MSDQREAKGGVMAGVKKAKTNNLTNIPFIQTLPGVCGKLARAGVCGISRPGQLSAVSVKICSQCQSGWKAERGVERSEP